MTGAKETKSLVDRLMHSADWEKMVPTQEAPFLERAFPFYWWWRLDKPRTEYHVVGPAGEKQRKLFWMTLRPAHLQLLAKCFEQEFNRPFNKDGYRAAFEIIQRAARDWELARRSDRALAWPPFNQLPRKIVKLLFDAQLEKGRQVFVFGKSRRRSWIHLKFSYDGEGISPTDFEEWMHLVDTHERLRRGIKWHRGPTSPNRQSTWRWVELMDVKSFLDEALNGADRHALSEAHARGRQERHRHLAILKRERVNRLV